jgi:hypothetical protein
MKREGGATVVNPIQLQKYLGGVHYPTNKNELVQKAQAKGADNSTVRALRGMRDGRFDSPVDVSAAIFNR